MKYFVLSHKQYPQLIILAFGAFQAEETQRFLLDHELGALSEDAIDCARSSEGMSVATLADNYFVYAFDYPIRSTDYEILMHELFHTTMLAGRVLGYYPSRDSEEFYAYYHGLLCKDVFQLLWNLPEDFWRDDSSCQSSGNEIINEGMANTRRKIVVLADRHDLRTAGIKKGDVLDAQVSGNRANPFKPGLRTKHLLQGDWRFATADEVSAPSKDSPATGDGSISPDGDNLQTVPRPQTPTGQVVYTGQTFAEPSDPSENPDEVPDLGEEGQEFPPLEDAESEDPGSEDE